jgi:hypothetical protein
VVCAFSASYFPLVAEFTFLLAAIALLAVDVT